MENKKVLLLHVHSAAIPGAAAPGPVGYERVELRILNRANGKLMIGLPVWAPIDVTQEVITDGQAVTAHLGELEIDGKIFGPEFLIEVPVEDDPAGDPPAGFLEQAHREDPKKKNRGRRR